MDLQTQLQELKTSTQAKLAEMRGEHSKELVRWSTKYVTF